MKRTIQCFVVVCVLVSGVYGGYYELNDGEYGYGIRLENYDYLVVNGGGADQIIAYDNATVEVQNTSTPLVLCPS